MYFRLIGSFTQCTGYRQYILQLGLVRVDRGAIMVGVPVHAWTEQNAHSSGVEHATWLGVCLVV